MTVKKYGMLMLTLKFVHDDLDNLLILNQSFFKSVILIKLIQLLSLHQ